MTPVTLEGAHVRLEPLEPGHLDALEEIALDPDLWAWTRSNVETRAALDRYAEAAWADRDAGLALPFATVLRESGRAIGSTRFGAYSEFHRRVEIGWTWVGRPWQRTAVNTEAKLLMLRHAFGALDLNRVEWKTDALNARSRAALLRLGAVEEGTLRAHMVTEQGRVRDTVYFSVTRDDWPAVEAGLVAKLNR